MKPYIDTAPGKETWEEARAWQGCPTIARTKGGRLFAGWYTGGMFEPCIDNFNVLVKSDDGGETWSKPILAVYTDRERMHRNIDIQLWVDPEGQLWIMWTHSPYYEGNGPATIRTPFSWAYHKEFTGVEVLLCRNPDAEVLTYEEPRDLCPGFLRCKPIVTRDGRYLFPAYDWVHPDRYYLRFSDDRGQTFYDVPASEKMGPQAFDETMVYERDDLMRMLVRTNTGCIAYADSADGGKHWTETKPYQKGPSARFYIGWLRCGLLALVRACSEGGDRTGMKICLSDDGGETWKWELVLDTRTGVSYPDLCEDDDGHIFVIHDRERDNRIRLNKETWTSDAAKEILLSRVTVGDIKDGTLHEGSYAARVISRGLVNTVEK